MGSSETRAALSLSNIADAVGWIVDRTPGLWQLDLHLCKIASRFCRLYVHTMNNLELAEAYCDRMFSAAAKEQGPASKLSRYGDPSTYEMYLALIEVGSTEWSSLQSFVSAESQLVSRVWMAYDPTT